MNDQPIYHVMTKEAYQRLMEQQSKENSHAKVEGKAQAR